MGPVGSMTAPPVPLLSVVIPVGPGDEAWRALLPALLPEVAGRGEVLLSATTPAPEDLGRVTAGGEVRWCDGPAGRARQQNRAAARARGRFLWFLHADSAPVPGTVPILLGALARDPGAMWYFDLHFQADGPRAVLLNEAGAWVRSRALGLPFGDQGLALARDRFEALGGFREDVPYGEDHLLVWAARRAGCAVRPIGLPLGTSARRYREQGWLRTTARFAARTWAQALPEAWRWLRTR